MIIKHLKLYCSNLSELKHFYTKKFRFELLREKGGSITLKAGDSLLTFTENKLQNSYYHFALNIPYGDVSNALKWVKKKVDILDYEGNEMLDFSAWSAKSFYFLDPAGNVVEFIGREKLQSEKKYEEAKAVSFTEKSVLHISEAGVPVFQVSSAVDMIKRETGIPDFDCKDNTFCAIGDHRGLIILVDKAEKTWFPSDEQAKAFPLEIEFSQAGKLYKLILQPGDHLEIVEQKGNEKSS